MRKPYLQLLRSVGHRGDAVRCWLVDGTFVRNQRDVDFTNGAHHFTRRYIPLDEIWIDREAPGAGELDFLIYHQLHERALMLEGMPYLRALATANRAERALRRSSLVERGVGLLDPRDARKRVLLERVGRLGRDEVWIVDGRGVRDHFDCNFTHGGHHWRYRFIPRRHIWIDDAVATRELTVTVAHEVHELQLMRAGMRYDDAHEHALAVEKALRRRARRTRVRVARLALDHLPQPLLLARTG